MDEAAVKCEVFTLLNAFDRATLWHTGDFKGRRHMIICGSLAPLPMDVQGKECWLHDNPAFRQSLEGIRLFGVTDVLSLYGGQERDLGPWLQDAVVNRDWAMRLEYLAGRAFTYERSEEIFQTIASYRVFPENLFTNLPPTAEVLRSAFDRP